MLNPFMPPFKGLFGFGEDEKQEDDECEDEDMYSYPDFDEIDDDALSSMNPDYKSRKKHPSSTDDYEDADTRALEDIGEQDESGHGFGPEF